MKRLASRMGAAMLALAAAGPVAASPLCGTSHCAITIAFNGVEGASGGTLSSDGATITFGAGGALDLAGGAIDLGQGGSLTPPDGNMGNGGSLVLGPGGSIAFGPGGILRTGDAGGIDAGASFDIGGSGSLTIQSAGTVGLGTLDTGGSIDLEAGGDMWDSVPEPPVNAHDSIDVQVRAGGDVTWKSIQGAPRSMTLKSGGDIHVGATGENTPGSGYQSGQGCGDTGTAGTTVYSYQGANPENTTISCSQSIGDPGSLEAGSLDGIVPGVDGGALPAAMLLLGLAGLLRRRR